MKQEQHHNHQKKFDHIGNKSTEVISVFNGLVSLAHLVNGRGAVLEALGAQGDRLKLLTSLQSNFFPSVFLLTHPSDMKSVWIDNASKLNKHGHAYNALRHVFGRGLIPIETSEEWKANQKVVAKHMQPRHITNLENYTFQYLDEMIAQENPDGNHQFVMHNVNESLIMMSFRLTAQVFLGRDASKEEAVSVSEEIHIVNQFLLANAVMGGLPDFFYRHMPLLLHRVHQAEQRMKIYADEIVKADTQLTGYMKALIAAGPQGTGQMTTEAQRDEVILAIISSYVSTATAIGWALAFLSQPQYMHYQDIVRAEVANGTAVNADSITAMIIKEGLRLFPPVFVMARKATEDVSIDNVLGKLSIPQGSSVFISPYITHRSPKHWVEPNQFNPLRFQSEIVDYSYLPFGLGERKCIGEHYTAKVAQNSLGYILNSYHVSMIRPPQPMFRATLHPSHSFSMKLTAL